MSSVKKLTYGMIAAEMPAEDKTTVVYDGAHDSIEIDVKRTLGINDAMEYVNSIVKLCADSAVPRYSPEAIDFSMRICTLASYAGIPIPDKDNLDKAYRVVYETPLYSRVIGAINKEQNGVLIDAAMKMIEFEKKTMLSAAAMQINELITKLNAFMEDSTELVSGLSSDEFRKQLDELVRLTQTLSPATDHDGAGETAIPAIPEVKIVPFKSGKDV